MPGRWKAVIKNMRIFSPQVKQSAKALAQGSSYQFDDKKYHKVLKDVKSVYHDYVEFNEYPVPGESGETLPTFKEFVKKLKDPNGKWYVSGEEKATDLFEDHKDRKKFTEKIATTIVKDNKANGISLDKDRVKGELESVLNIRELFLPLPSPSLADSVTTTKMINHKAIMAANKFFNKEINPEFNPEFKNGVLDNSICPKGEVNTSVFNVIFMDNNDFNPNDPEFYNNEFDYSTANYLIDNADKELYDKTVSEMLEQSQKHDWRLEIDPEGNLESSTAVDKVMEMLRDTASHNTENEDSNIMIEPSESDINIDWENDGPGSSQI